MLIALDVKCVEATRSISGVEALIEKEGVCDMKQSRTVAIVLGALLTVSAAAFAAGSQTPATAAKSSAAKKAPAAAAAPASHAMMGVVKSIDDTKLVTTKAAGKGPETTFVLNASTQKEGAIAVGSMVDVRYTTEGKQKVATAVSLHSAKPAKK